MNENNHPLNSSQRRHEVDSTGDGIEKTFGQYQEQDDVDAIGVSILKRPIDIPKHNDNDSSLHDTNGVYRMIALDLDGTLLQTNHQLAAESVDYLQHLNKIGIGICIATGRAPQSVYEHVEKLALPNPIPVICSNGSRGFMLGYSDSDQSNNGSSLSIQKYQKEIFYTPVSYTVVKMCIELATKLGYCIQYYLGDHIYTNATTEDHHSMIQQYEIVTDTKMRIVDDHFQQFISTNMNVNDDTDLSPDTSCGLPSKLIIRFNKDEFDTAYQMFSEALCSDDASSSLATIIAGFIPATDWFLEILHPNVNKGLGLAKMCQHLNVDIEQVIAIGDGTNDIEFLQMSGLGIAMKNAHESLQKVANYTMKYTNDEHGVMKTLQQLQQKGQLQPKEKMRDINVCDDTKQ